MATSCSFAVLTLLVFTSVCFSSAQYEMCGTNRTVLLRALFNTADNLYQMDRVFFPTRLQSSRYIKVEYTFINTSTGLKDENCTVTYIWALGGFLLVQPPKIFRFTSLLISTPANELKFLNITLPSECKVLVSAHKDGTCTCEKATALARLTQQLNEYSKYGDPTHVVQDITSNAQAVCDDNLKEEFFQTPEINVFLSLTLFIPFIFMVILVLVVRSTHVDIHKMLTMSSKHHSSLAGFTLAGTHLLVFVLCMDCAAVYYYAKKDHEYKNDGVNREFNLYILGITCGLDAVVTSQFLLCMLYLCCAQMHKDNCCEVKCRENKCCKDTCQCCRASLKVCLEKGLPCFFVPYFYTIFGSKALTKKIWGFDRQLFRDTNAKTLDEDPVTLPEGTTVISKEPEDLTATLTHGTPTHRTHEDRIFMLPEGIGTHPPNTRVKLPKDTPFIIAQQITTIWVLTGIMVAPLFSLASHAGYILIAWVTEPVKTTAAFLIGVGSIVYLFLMFKQCYTIYKNAEEKDHGLFQVCAEVKYKWQRPTKKCLCIKIKPKNDNGKSYSTCCSRLNDFIKCTNQDDRPARMAVNDDDRVEISVEPRDDDDTPVIANNEYWLTCNCIIKCLTCRKYWITCFIGLCFPILPLCIMLSHVANLCCMCCLHCCRDGEETPIDLKWNHVEKPKPSYFFSIRAFCMACSWGWLVVASLAFVISAFYVIPLPTLQLAEYLENTIQILIVLLAFLITYKIFTVEDSDVQKFMRKFRSKKNDDIEDDAEAAGARAGKLTNLVIQSYERRTNESQTQTGKDTGITPDTGNAVSSATGTTDTSCQITPVAESMERRTNESQTQTGKDTGITPDTGNAVSPAAGTTRTMAQVHDTSSQITPDTGNAVSPADSA